MAFRNLQHFIPSTIDPETVCGIDEVGRGPWAGPLVACALMFTKNFQLNYSETPQTTGTGLEREVVRLRYGLDDGRERTLEEVGQLFGITRERVRQIEFKAMRKLRQPDRCTKLEGYLTH